MFSMLSGKETKGRGGEEDVVGEVHMIELRTMTLLALYWLCSCSNADVLVIILKHYRSM